MADDKNVVAESRFEVLEKGIRGEGVEGVKEGMSERGRGSKVFNGGERKAKTVNEQKNK